MVGNTFTQLSKSATYLYNTGIYCVNYTGNAGKVGENYSTIGSFTMVNDSGSKLTTTFSP